MKLLWNRWKQMNFKVKISTQRGDPGCTRLAVPAEPQLMDSSVPSESLRVALVHWYVLGPWCYTVRTGVAVELESHPLHKDMDCWLQGFCVFSCKYLPHKWSGLHRHLFFFSGAEAVGPLSTLFQAHFTETTALCACLVKEERFLCLGTCCFTFYLFNFGA